MLPVPLLALLLIAAFTISHYGAWLLTLDQRNHRWLGAGVVFIGVLLFGWTLLASFH